MSKHSKRPIIAPSLDGCLYFSAEGKKITREEFTKTKPYAVTVGEMCRHLEALTAWMRSQEVTA